MTERTIASSLLLSLLLFVGLALSSACTSPDRSPVVENGLKKITFNMGWLPQGSMSGVMAAIDQGFYAERGLDVTTMRGFGGIRTVNEIDQGMFDFGYGDALAVIMNRVQGGRTKLIGAINNRWPAGLCFVTERHQLRSPKDLVGLKIGGGQTSPMQVILPVWLQSNDVDASKVEILQLDPAIVAASLIEGRIDAGECWLANSIAVFQKRAKDAGLTVDWIEYADFNLDIYGNGLVTSERLIEEQPELVRNFVEATYEGYAFVLDNPESAAAIVVDQYPVLEPEVTLQQVREISALISGPDSLGWLDREKVARTLEFISSSYELDTSISVDEIYTAQFLE